MSRPAFAAAASSCCGKTTTKTKNKMSRPPRHIASCKKLLHSRVHRSKPDCQRVLKKWSNPPRPGGRVGYRAQTHTVSEPQEQASDRRRPLQPQNTSDDSPVRAALQHHKRLARPPSRSVHASASAHNEEDNLLVRTGLQCRGRFICLLLRPIHPPRSTRPSSPAYSAVASSSVARANQVIFIQVCS